MHISDVEKRTGLPATAIRYYENCGLVQVKRKANGYRTYDEDTLKVLFQIRQLRQLGINLADIRLWRDGVVTFNELITKRLRTMEDDSKKSRECRQLCEALLHGTEAAELLILTGEFREEETTGSNLPDGPLLLGIDIGTTSISVQVVAADNGACVQTYNFDHNAAVPVDGYPDAFAADAQRLMERTLALIASVTETYKGIASIGIAGQMHGILCLDDKGEILSPLYTWQNQFGQRKPDGKCTICEEITALCGETIPTGYGIATYYALGKLGILPNNTDRIVTIMDLLVSRLTGNEPVLHPTNAAAMGAYDLTAGKFQEGVLEKLHVPRTLLPNIVDGYTVVGEYAAADRRIPVAVAIGDSQAGLFGSLADDRSVLVNVGTSSQVSIVCTESVGKGGEVRPYFDGKYIRSGAALCGGRAYAMLKNFIRSIACGLGLEISDRAVYDYLNRAAEGKTEDSLAVSTQFSGTRTDPNARGAITNIGLHNFTPEALSAGVLHGIIDELYKMYDEMNPDRNPASDRGRLVVSGNAMRKNPALRKICAAVFQKELSLPAHTEEAAFGAALFGGVSAGILTREESYTRVHYQDAKEEIR